jgi:3-oxoacyl-[acyl-carrier protein] reductase
MQLASKTAVVTGGSRGIGKEIAKVFARQGANVAVIDLDGQGLEELKQESLSEDLPITAFKGDVTKKEEIGRIFDSIVSEHGSLDILVNNAGVIRDNLFFKMDESDWDTVMNVHLKGAFFCSHEAQKHMVKQQYGRIINISSTSALGNRGQANYATAKAGIQGFTKTLAIELGQFGVTANAIAPGFIETDMTRATAERIGISFDDLIEANKKAIPVRRSGKPADIANAALFFALEASSFVTGQVIYVAGGPRT